MPSDTPVVLVTGAAKRVGAEIARHLHAAGCNLALHYRHSEADMQALIAELEQQRAGSTLALQADLADITTLPGLVEATITRFGRLDGLVNNASNFYATPLDNATPAQWDDLMAVNAKAPFFLSQAAAPHLRASAGAIVNIIDIYSECPLTNHLLYSTAKAALRMTTLALAQALGPDIRVNAVAPGTVLWSDKPTKAETPRQVIEGTALQRVGQPADVASAVRFLLFDAHYSTGSILPVDGGRSLNR